MTIVVTGAGSGGHITPILAVAHELKGLDPQVKIVYIGQSGDKLADIPKGHTDIDETFSVSAGKLRRYHQSGLREVFDIPTHLKNIRDVWRVFKGIIQSYRLLGRIKPDAIFIKGGYIGVPVGLSAALRRIPYVTHDSDAIPGLANRIIARWAKIHATGMPKEYYSYSPDTTETVGVPISRDYRLVNEELKNEYKKDLELAKFEQIILITGGGLGARRINEAAADIMPQLLKTHPSLAVVHVVGRGNESSLEEQYKRELTRIDRSRIIIKGFITDLYIYSGAADLIVTRAGATNLAEFAVQAKACIVIPNPFLVGGHQLKNAKALADRGAIRILDEKEMGRDKTILLNTINELLNSASERKKIAVELGKLAQPEAALKLARLILGLGKSK